MEKTIRLNKFLAQCKIPELGKISRRGADQLISAGKVKVNGKVVTTLGLLVDPGKDFVRVNDKHVKPDQTHIHLILNKPKKFIVSRADEAGRPTVFDLLGKEGGRLVAAGRLDYNSEGLLLFTTDGWLINRLTHPKFKIQKIYHVKVKEKLTYDEVKRFQEGIVLDGKKTMPAGLKFLWATGKNCWYEVSLHEGRQRQIRRMFEALGHFVLKLKRISYGPLTLQGLMPGQYRKLSPREVDLLYWTVEK
jgi:pseudouridine synthase